MMKSAFIVTLRPVRGGSDTAGLEKLEDFGKFVRMRIGVS